jgi:transcriptional regulator GlxA family with amidase domain
VIWHALAQDRPSAGPLDKQIQSALVALCDKLAQAWTVDGLAERVFMSRSSFVEHINTLVGKSQMEFLAEWRMQRARHWLERDRLSVVGPGEFRCARAP